jgi:hypothetical protein
MGRARSRGAGRRAVAERRNELSEKWASVSFEAKIGMFVAPIFVAVVTG